MLSSRASYVAAEPPSLATSDSSTLDEDIARLEVRHHQRIFVPDRICFQQPSDFDHMRSRACRWRMPRWKRNSC